MTKYIPFLKLKSNEIMAVKELDDDLRQALTPFFDFPYKKDRTEDDFKKSAERMVRSIQKHIQDIPYFYLDNFDVNSSLTVEGNNNYSYLLTACEDLPVVPVISIDRSPTHMQAVCDAKDSEVLKSDRIALRFVAADFESFDVVAGEIKKRLGVTFRKFANVDLVLDCRVCLNQDLDSLASDIALFLQQFTEIYSVDTIIVAGSSMPPSIGDILKVQCEQELPRAELEIYEQVYDEVGDDFDIVLGDYGIVSPNYSDIDIMPEAMLRVTAPKIIYSHDKHHFIIRGGALRTHVRGFRQYNDLAKIVVDKPFYRGADYSFGDNYIEEKSRSVGKKVTPSTIIKPTVNSHITYMLNDYFYDEA